MTGGDTVFIGPVLRGNSTWRWNLTWLASQRTLRNPSPSDPDTINWQPHSRDSELEAVWTIALTRQTIIWRYRRGFKGAVYCKLESSR